MQGESPVSITENYNKICKRHKGSTNMSPKICNRTTEKGKRKKCFVSVIRISLRAQKKNETEMTRKH